jgi:hypothetical protein
VAEQQDPDCLPPDTRNQFPLHRFLSDQAHCPPRLTLGRLTTDHGDDALLLRGIQQLLGTATLTLEQSTLQAAFLVAMRDPSHGLRRQMDDPSYGWRRLALCQLLQGDGPQDHPYLQDARPQ